MAPRGEGNAERLALTAPLTWNDDEPITHTVTSGKVTAQQHVGVHFPVPLTEAAFGNCHDGTYGPTVGVRRITH